MEPQQTVFVDKALDRWQLQLPVISLHQVSLLRLELGMNYICGILDVFNSPDLDEIQQ